MEYKICNYEDLSDTDRKKIQEDFDKLVKRINCPDFTQRILDARRERGLSKIKLKELKDFRPVV